MKKSNKYFLFSKLLIFLFIFFACNLTAQAQDYEHILNFHSDIKIDTTGRIDVTETITIRVTGESIQRGIVRSIPIYRENAQNLKKRIDIEVDSVFKNGTIEHFSTKKENQDLAIYIGEENKTIAPNIYEYKIKYSSRGHVGFFDNYDEIYWNVNGNDWEFDIDSVSATVHLPRGAKFIDNSCYTGILDSKASDCSSYTVGDSIIKYQTNSKLNRKEGLTIAASFTPNIINRPPPPTAFESFMESKGVIILFIIFVICIIYYYIVSLRKVNTMNGHKIMIPTFDPPLNKSAGELNYLYKREASKTTLVSSILSMAVKKAIVIKKEKSSYILTALGETNDLSAEESSLYKNMFTSAGDAVTLGKKNTLPSKALEGLESTLKTQDKIKDYFLPKESYIYKFWIGAICVLFVWLLILQATTSFLAKDMFILTIAKICVISLVPAWYIAKKTHFAVFIVMLTIMSSFSKDIGDLTSTAVQSYSNSLAAILLILEILFSKYIYPLTSKGVQFSGELEGFKKYLTVAEENRLNMLTPPDLTPEQFEKMLPYAVALGLEVKWAKKFEKSFPITSDYQPNWYIGSSNGSYIKFTKSLSKSLSSSVNRSISTLTSAGASYGGSSSGSRGWSSGSGGRGSSGRGGGGGGGRGW